MSQRPADTPVAILLRNLLWFGASLALAFFVWVIATLQADPILQSRVPNAVPVRLQPDEGLLVVSTQPTNPTVSLRVRAPRSVLDILSPGDLDAWADLGGLGPGEHSVRVRASIGRPQASVVDLSPSFVRVTLEQASQRQVPLTARMDSEPPAGYFRDEPVYDLPLDQVLVSGPRSRVEQVVAAQVTLDLFESRNNYQAILNLTAVDAAGLPITGLTLDPPTVAVSVEIKRRDDVREVAVRPNLVGRLPEGYVLNALGYTPQIVLVSGAPGRLAALPDTLSTAPIDLSTLTASLETEVPVLLPAGDYLLLSGQSVTVTIEVEALTASLQFENIPVEIIGLGEGLTARAVPNQVTVLVTGPQPELARLTRADIMVTLDLVGLAAGNYTLSPTVTVGLASAVESTLLPAELDVEISPSIPAP
jgi:YbbR domain-containing protein